MLIPVCVAKWRHQATMRFSHLTVLETDWNLIVLVWGLFFRVGTECFLFSFSLHTGVNEVVGQHYIVSS